jgi:indolepyruvate ferredoxin oxidoreductase
MEEVPAVKAFVEATKDKNILVYGVNLDQPKAAVERFVAEMAPETIAPVLAKSLEEIVAKRADFLTEYQNAAYAGRYRALVERVRKAEAERAPGMSGLAEAAARYYFKLLAYKDEYEVARLYTDERFRAALESQFEGDYRLEFHLAPPLVAKRDPDSGLPLKGSYGASMLRVFGLLARLKFLRGSVLDPFGHTAERRRERRLIKDYEALVNEVLAELDHDRHRLAVALLSLPEQIRGYGHVKEAHLAKVEKRGTELREAFRTPESHRTAAE